MPHLDELYLVLPLAERLDDAVDAVARQAGELALEAVREDRTPSSILSKESFENAIALQVAVGGSTNGVLHLLALAAEAGIDLEKPRAITFSPDGQWLLFQREDNDALVRTSISGGGTLTLVEEDGVSPYDPHWGADGSIVFTGPQGLHRASGGGGEVTQLSTTLNGRNPFMLPDGSGVLAGTFNDGVHYYDLEADSSWQLIPDATHPVYIASGHILYIVSGSGLFAAPFDLETASVTSPPRPILDQVASNANRRAYAISEDGTLVFLRGEPGGADGDNRFVVFDRAGNGDTLAVRTGDLANPRFSPDGRRIAYALDGGDGSTIHTFDLLTGEPRQITFEGDAGALVWSPNGSRIAYSAQGEDGSVDMFVKPSDNSGPERLLRGGEGWQVPTDWPTDSLLVMFTGTDDSDLVALRLGGDGDSAVATPYLRADWHEYALDLAPQGDLAALVSHEADEADVWIRTFPDPVGKWRVSDDGGTAPFSAATFVAPDGRVTRLDADEFGIEETGRWSSPRGGSYPSGWILRIPALDLELVAEPRLLDQELDLAFRYWEGAVGITGTRDDAPVQGRGYVELTGYADGPRRQ